MCVICNLIKQAKNGDKSCMEKLIATFIPLIKKYSYKLNYEDAENDLIISLLQLIYDMPLSNNDGQAVNYIS